MKQCRILVVDDEPFVVDWIADLLEHDDGAEMEYDICRAYCAEEAVNWFRRARIDLMVTDIQMPGTSGLELAVSVRELWPACQVAFLTAYARFDYAYKAVQIGVAGYILKSEEDRQILDKLHAAIRLVKEAPETAEQHGHARESAALGRFFDGQLDETALLRRLGWQDKRSFCLFSVCGMVSSDDLDKITRTVDFVCDGFAFAKRLGGFRFLLDCTDRENVPSHLKNLLEWIQDDMCASCCCLIGPVVDISHLAAASAHAEAHERGERRGSGYIYCYSLEKDGADGENMFVRFIQQYVDANISGDVSLVRLSEVTGYNASYISRLYSEVTGERLSHFISRKRMDNIRALMAQRVGTLEEISVMAGFNSRTYFNRFVRQNTGMQPSELMKQLKTK